MDNPEVLANEVQNNEHLYLLNAIPENEVNDGYAIDVENNEDTQSEQSFVLDDDDIADEDEQQPVPPRFK